MKTDHSVEELLRWRLARAEAEAPPAPRTAHLLKLGLPWWETCPERFRSVSIRLSKLQAAHGHALAEPVPSSSSHPVPVMIVCAGDEFEASARILFLTMRNGRMGLGFRLESEHRPIEPEYEVTLVMDASTKPLLAAQASLSTDSEYRLEVILTDELAKRWEQLKVTDRMPFRLILRTATADG